MNDTKKEWDNKIISFKNFLKLLQPLAMSLDLANSASAAFHQTPAPLVQQTLHTVPSQACLWQ